MTRADLVVVGFGLAGAVVATSATAAGLRVIVLEAGLVGPTKPGQHVSADPRLAFASDARNRLTRGLLVPIKAETSRFARGAEFAVGAACGGAGALWSGICERLDGPTAEGRIFLDACVEPMYPTAEKVLGVVDAIDAVGDVNFAGWPAIRSMRIAAVCAEQRVHVPGPADILRAGSGQSVDVRHGRVATAIVHSGGTAKAVSALNLHTGRLEHYGAETIIVAADAVRSPALLIGSGLGSEAGFPVGQWLADHPLAVARVDATTEEGRALAQVLLTRPGETVCRGVALAPGPHGGMRLIVSILADDPGQRHLMLFWYGVGHPRPQNRLRFGTDNAQGFGTRHASVRLEEPYASEESLVALVEDLIEFAGRLGTPLRGWTPRLLPFGSAMHLFGTLRTAMTSGEPGVTDSDGKVRGFRNLLIAGPARLPAACATNPVLASTAAALRTVASLTGAPPERSAPSRISGGRTGPTD